MTESQERLIHEVLWSDELPTGRRLGTSYRQILVAWAKAHRLSLTEFLARLEHSGMPRAEDLAAEIRSDPRNMRAFEIALASPLHG